MAVVSQAPATLDIVAVKGDSLTVTVSVTENSVAYDWTGATVASAILQDGTAVATNFTTATPANGTLTLSLTDAQTTTLGVATYRWWVSVTKSSATRTWLAGTLSVTEPGWGGTSTSSASLAITTGSTSLAITSINGGTASQIAVTDSADYYVGSSVETVLQELPTKFGPYESGNTLIPLGDSLLAASSNGQWVEQLANLSGGRFVVLRNAGVAGNTSTQMLARISSDVIAYAPDWCLLQATPNDPGQSVSVATSISNFKSMIGQLRKNNIRPIFVVGPPSDTATNRDHILQVSQNVASYCFTRGIPVLDLYTPLVDPADGTFLAANTSDGTHLSAAGVNAAAVYNVALLPSSLQRQPLTLATGANDPLNLAANGLFLTDSNSDGLSDSWFKAGTGTTTRTSVTSGYGLGTWQNISPVDATLTQVYQDVTTVVGNLYRVAVRVKASGSGYRLRAAGYDTPTTSSTAVTLGDITEAQGAVISICFVATTTSSRILLGAGGAAGTTSFAQFTIRNLTAINALG